MDQLFINERDLPPTPRSSAQRFSSQSSTESLRQRERPETPLQPAGEEENFGLWPSDRNASDERSRQDRSSDAGSLSGGQAKDRAVHPPTTSGSEEEVLRMWPPNEDTSSQGQTREPTETSDQEQNFPGYSQRAMQLALQKRLGAPGQARPSPVDSPSGLQGSREETGRRSFSALDIYESGSDRENISTDPSSSIGASGDGAAVGNRSILPRRYSRSSRPYPVFPSIPSREDANSSGNIFRQAGNLPSQIFRGPIPQTEVVVPRWQPDAEVTYCPICRTQFSFFVRKHHCRKCGRVVCNACSPHRITIPHQYIVHLPEDLADTSTTSRPSLDSSRTRSSTISTNLGGGERVRLCNPCVPDPNIAPPQTRSDGQHIQSQGHSRSASHVVSYTQSRRGDLDIPSYHQPPRDPSLSIEERYARNLAWNSSQQGSQQTSSSYSQRDSSLLRPELEARSRSSTVGSTREVNHPSLGNHRQQHHGVYLRPYNPLVPRPEDVLSRPLPDTPLQQQRSMPRRPIPEEDQCWVCFHELPSRYLPNFQALRDAHVMNCLDNATRRNSPAANRTSMPPAARRETVSNPTNTDTRLPLHTNATASSSSTIQALSTPESRMLARERQHAAIVYGQPSSSSSSAPSPMSRVIPYIASEKDGIDDAECMVCLEDFEVGQEMGRLECFCRFHLKCIQHWFEKKPGKCPVHGVDG